MSDQTMHDDSKATFVTKEGYQKLKEELEYLENVKRREIAQRIKEAASYGDLSENSEYEEAKNEQAFVEGRILVLNEQIKFVKIIEEDTANSQHKTVQLGLTVTVKALDGAMKGKSVTYTIVGTTEADPFNQKISNESPLGAALLEKKVGDKMKVESPSGVVEYQITKIE